MIGLSHVALAGALAACLAGIGGYAKGVGAGEAREQAAQFRVARATALATAKLQQKLDAATEQAANAEIARQGKVREITRETLQIIERPVYRNLCVDADGVRLLDKAAAAANAENIPPPAGGAAETAGSAPHG